MKKLFVVSLVVLTLLLGSSAFAVGSWTRTEDITEGRMGFTSTLLNNGKLLITGGSGSERYNSAMLYNPTTNKWESAGNMSTTRVYHSATLLPNGKVLVVGGDSIASKVWAEIYNPENNTWESKRNIDSFGLPPSAILLPNGKVLVISYINIIGSMILELYDYRTNEWTTAGTMQQARVNFTTTLLADGKVLVTGGSSPDTGELNTAEVYDPETNTWSMTGNMRIARMEPSATLLANGKVLVSGGGDDEEFATKTIELYNPQTNEWELAGNTIEQRAYFTTTLLQNGKLLISGGYSPDYKTLNTAEIYDPETNKWTSAGSMKDSRYSHTAVLLPTGKVLILLGLLDDEKYLTTSEIYDPASNVWTRTGNLLSGRIMYEPVLLENGKVLVTGGFCQKALSLTEVYNPSGTTIFPEQYTQRLNRTVILSIDKSKAYTNGNETIIDSTNLNVYPFIKDDRTLVPVRFISENLGAKVYWDEETSTVTVTDRATYRSVEMTIGSKIIDVDGEKQEIEVPAQIYNDRTFIPLRALAEGLGKKVYWDDRGLIIISDSTFDAINDKALIDEVVGKFNEESSKVSEINNEFILAGIRSNMLMAEGILLSEIDNYAADAEGIAKFESKIDSEVNSVTIENQKIRNPVTGNKGSILLDNIGTGAIVHATNDNANDGTDIDMIWTNQLPNSAGSIVYCAYVDTKSTRNRISVKIMPYGQDNKRITELEKVISQ